MYPIRYKVEYGAGKRGHYSSAEIGCVIHFMEMLHDSGEELPEYIEEREQVRDGGKVRKIKVSFGPWELKGGENAD